MEDTCLAVAFEIHGDDCPLAEASATIEGRIEAEPPQLRFDGNALLQFTAPPSATLRETLDADNRLRYLHVSRGERRDTFRCLSKHPCVVHELVDTGCIVETVTYERGTAQVFGAVVGRDVLRMVLEAAGQTVGVTLERAFPLERDRPPTPSERWDITPKQEACLRAAVAAGYFSIPREATASEVANDLDISKSAFLERLHRAEETLFSQLFAGETVESE
jgi:predicted DNA binding protein